MRVVTLNVRNPSFNDGEHAWPHRRAEFFETLRRLDPDVLCLQEVEQEAFFEIVEGSVFHRGYATGRDDGLTKGEMCPVLWRKSLPHGRHKGTEWLSETPEAKGALGWDAKCPRIVSWVDFGEWAILNTHLDHVGLGARAKGMAQVIRRADALGKPCLIVGDLNATPGEPPLELARAAGFVDPAEGTGPTFHGFGKEPEIRIDYVLARGPWACRRAWVERGEYSDHWAVVVDLELG